MCKGVNQYTQLLIEAGPLAVFFVTNSQAGIMAGTGAFMAATVSRRAAVLALRTQAADHAAGRLLLRDAVRRADAVA